MAIDPCASPFVLGPLTDCSLQSPNELHRMPLNLRVYQSLSMCTNISQPIKTSIDSCSNKTTEGKFIQSGGVVGLFAGHRLDIFVLLLRDLTSFYGLNNCLLSNNHTFMNQLAP